MIKLSGVMRNLKSSEAWARFFYPDTGAVVVGEGVTGPNLPHAAREPVVNGEGSFADFLEFELDDKPCRGWVSRNPFRNGDVVDVVADWLVDHYEIRAIARSSDQMVALYPDCSQGRLQYFAMLLRWFVGITIFNMAFFGLICGLSWLGSDGDSARFFLAAWGWSGLLAMLLSAWFCLYQLRDNLRRVSHTEACLRVLGFPDPSRTDLGRYSLRLKTPQDPVTQVGKPGVGR